MSPERFVKGESERTLGKRAEMALKAAVEKAVEEHVRDGPAALHLARWQGG